MKRSYNYDDLTGKQFGRWEVLQRQGVAKGNKLYLCRCTCPKKVEKVLTASQLNCGRTQSCGCLRAEALAFDMKGKKVGKLLVTRLLRTETGKGYVWECQCECGNVVEATGGKLAESIRENRMSSCGCYQIRYKTGRGKHDYIKEHALREHAKIRARKCGVPFDISVEDVVIPKVCPLLGIPIEIGNKGIWKDNSPSIDRKIPSLGYMKGNIWVISYRANRIKNDATVEELELLAKGMRKVYEESGFDCGATEVRP